MMIAALTDAYDRGYLESPPHGTLTAYFPNCNLAVRRAALEAVGPYDERHNHAAEDADLCRRVKDAGWELFYEPRAACFHEARRGLRAFGRQWFSYGFHSAAFFRKYQDKRLEIFTALDRRPRCHRFRRIVGSGVSPFRVLIFLSGFTAGILGFLLWLPLVAFGPAWLAASWGGTLALLQAARIRRSPARRRGLRAGLVYLLVNGVANFSCLAGSLAGGLKNRMLYMYPGI